MNNSNLCPVCKRRQSACICIENARKWMRKTGQPDLFTSLAKRKPTA